jgi:hypothetical protein
MNNDYNLNNLIGSEGLIQQKEVPKIRVVVRKRPANKKEIQRNDIDIIELRASQTVVVKELKYKYYIKKKQSRSYKVYRRASLFI